MQYRPLGRTGIEVSTLCLGTMMFGAWGNPRVDECHEIISEALDAGINFVDTADMYAQGQSEEIVGEALRGRRDSVVLATKFSLQMGEGPNRSGNSRRWINAAVDASLRRLQTDWIDLYQIHRPDPTTDIDETLGALTDLVRAGKVRAIGSSTFPAEQLVEAAWVSNSRMRERLATEQPPYSIFVRGAEAHVLPTCRKLGMAAVVWAPMNAGWLSGKYGSGQPPAPDSRAAREPDHFDYGTPAAERKLAMLGPLTQLASDVGCSLPHLALAFVLRHPAVTAAIVGPRLMHHLTSALGAESLSLDESVLDRIDDIVAPGETVSALDTGYVNPALVDRSASRR